MTLPMGWPASIISSWVQHRETDAGTDEHHAATTGCQHAGKSSQGLRMRDVRLRCCVRGFEYDSLKFLSVAQVRAGAIVPRHSPKPIDT
jgi:hypothetical protein